MLFAVTMPFPGPGGDAALPDSPMMSCPQGLATRFSGARSIQQCYTSPGYGRTVSMSPEGVISYVATLCPVGTYNTGGNPAGCQSCASGLTTSGNGSQSASSCCELRSLHHSVKQCNAAW